MQQDPNQPQGPFQYPPQQMQQWPQQGQPQWQQPVMQGQTPPVQQPVMGGQPMPFQQPMTAGQPQPFQQPMTAGQPQPFQQPMTAGQPFPFQQQAPGQQPFQQMPVQNAFEACMQEQPAMPTMQQSQQNEPPRKAKKNRRSPGGGGKNGLLIAAGVALALLVAAGSILFGGNRIRTAVVEAYEMGESYFGDALIVRNEIAFDEEGVQNIEYVAHEGSMVSRGDVVCNVFSTGYSTKEVNALQDYRDQIKDYQQTLLQSETAYDQKMTRLETDVLQRGLEVRSLVQGARGNLINQEIILQDAIEERQNYFRSKYSSDMRLNRLFDEESTQSQRIQSWIKQKISTQDSIVSFYTDGYEYALTPTEYETYSPAEVRAMINGQKPQMSTAARGRTILYRLVKPNNYAVLMLVRDNQWNPVEGTVYRLKLEQFTNTEVDAQVLSFTRSGGELLLRLAVIDDVSDVLYMRSCSASLGESVECLRVPEKALMEKNGTIGVVLVAEDNQVFVPVRVLRQGSGFANIAPVRPDTLKEGQSVRLF